MLPVPRHLVVSEAQTTVIRFTWDDWDTEVVEEQPDDALVDALQRTSDRAILALTIAMSEWIVFRFQPLEEQPLPSQFVEAAWAAGADWRYVSETWDAVVDTDGWVGPVKGPLSAAMMAVDNVISAARLGEDLTDGARWVSNIAVHVLPRPELFRRWRGQAVARLALLYPRQDVDMIGDVVPREALDMAREFLVEETETLVNQFLATLDYGANPFLASPEALVEAGFTGAPYTFDLARDREQRQLW